MKAGVGRSSRKLHTKLPQSASSDELRNRRQSCSSVIVPRSIKTIRYVCYSDPESSSSDRGSTSYERIRKAQTERIDAKNAINFLLSIHCQGPKDVSIGAEEQEALEPY